MAEPGMKGRLVGVRQGWRRRRVAGKVLTCPHTLARTPSGMVGVEKRRHAESSPKSSPEKFARGECFLTTIRLTRKYWEMGQVTGMKHGHRKSLSSLLGVIFLNKFGFLMQKLVVKAVSLAIARDGASGGVVRTVTINSEGVTKNFYPGDTLPLWHEELEPQNSLLDILSSSSPEPMVS
ncbi:Proteasome subunit beta type-6 [Vitis vinifera]|uniref:Proteasome subunit beta type-6 n=1 Tax=Vitis vinifera TaxID=29760 RepID=A0A438HWI5_VITVI|nr:Proteasome subunit beta type-6 [Vitis vinifera]